MEAKLHLDFYRYVFSALKKLDSFIIQKYEHKYLTGEKDLSKFCFAQKEK
jgi:hypothetical protein